MDLVFSDENEKLTPEIKALMQRAADEALLMEFGEELGAAGFAVEDIGAEIGVTVVSDDEIQALNCDYRGNDKVTDVLSFPQFEGHDDLLDDLVYSAESNAADETGEPGSGAVPEQTTLIGDVVICHDQAARQAEEYGTGITREMLYLFVHSIMHLFGYDHMEEEEKRVMRAREETVLSAIGLARYMPN